MYKTSNRQTKYLGIDAHIQEAYRQKNVMSCHDSHASANQKLYYLFHISGAIHADRKQLLQNNSKF